MNVSIITACLIAASGQDLADGGPEPGRVLWLRADRGVQKNFSNLVHAWQDLSGQRHHVSNPGGESLPEWTEVGIGGQPALRFDGNDWLLGTGMPTGSYTKVAVCRIDDRTFTNNVLSSTSHHALYFGGSRRARLFHSGDFVQSAVEIERGAPVRLVATYDASSGEGRLFQDGLLVGNGFAGGNWDTSILLGAFANGFFLKGAIAEVMVYDRVLPDGELAQIHEYLDRRYASLVPASVEWTELPRPGQVVQRDAADQAAVSVKGRVASPGWTDVTIEVTRDGAPWHSNTKPLVYGSDGKVAFAFAPVLNASRNDHEFSLFLGNGTVRELIARVPAVTVGDVYVVHGQSNAQASDYWGEGLGNQSQGHFIRSFGTSSIFGTTGFDLHWDRADGEISFGHAAAGQWGLRMAEGIAEGEQVPVAIVNGAVGGTAISQHQRNDANPFDPTTIYGRLHLRLVEAGVADSFRALLWYQGESDSWNPGGWINGWITLRADWAADYRALQRVYVIQIRTDCANGGQTIKEIQRGLPDVHADTTVMSTTALSAHDGCHYMYQGYRELGERMALLLRRDFFGSSDTHEIDPPNPLSATWGDPTQSSIAITFRDVDDVLVFDAGAEADFSTNLGDTVIGGTVTGNVLMLQLAGPSTASTVGYRGHAYDGPWLKTARGVGALCFQGLPIQ